MARHIHIPSPQGVELCDKCREPWPCVTERRRRPFRAKGVAKRAAKMKAGTLAPRKVNDGHVVGAILADLRKRGASTRRDIITRVFVELDGSETWQIEMELTELLRLGQLHLSGEKIEINT